MKIVGARYGNKNVKMTFWGKMMLCSDEIYWGKIATTNPPLRLLTTVIYAFRVMFRGRLCETARSQARQRERESYLWFPKILSLARRCTPDCGGPRL